MKENGNGHRYLCPPCNKGGDLAIYATVRASLLPDEMDHHRDTEWEDSSAAECGCGWMGKVREFKTVEVDE